MIKICVLFRNNPKASIRNLGRSLNLKKNNGEETTKANTDKKVKSEKFQEKERQQRQNANNLFKLLTSNPSKNDLKNVENDSLSHTNDVILKEERTEKETTSKIDSNKISNATSRLNELIKSAELFEIQKKQNIVFINRKEKHDNNLIEKLKSKEKDKKKLLESVRDIASNLGGDVEKTQKELMNAFQISTGQSRGKSVTFFNLKNFIDQMKVDREGEKSEDTPLSIHKSLKTQISKRTSEDKKLFSSNERLNIFSDKILEDKEGTDSNLQIWDYLEKLSLLELKAAPPRNYFQELIVWTQQGKLWHFPIDNEQDLNEEKKIHFSEHIFLDKYLEPWCPPGGPIRHFMELVTTALSKNNYLSVNEKKEHLMWYKSYFENKKKLLVELGALPQNKQN